MEAYREEEDAPHDAVMFTSKGAITSSNTLVKWLTRFFKKHGRAVQSHNFRATKATHYHEACKDLPATQALLGHRNPVTTGLYLKVDE